MTPSTSPMRSFGPWMSPMMGMYLPRSVAVRRMTSMTRRRSSGVPCEKLRRKTSTPEVRRRWMVSSALHAGPRVAMIFVRRMISCALSVARCEGVGCWLLAVGRRTLATGNRQPATVLATRNAQRATSRRRQRRLQRSSQHAGDRVHLLHELREGLGQDRLRSVRQRLLGTMVHFDQDAVGADGDRRARERQHFVALS